MTFVAAPAGEAALGLATYLSDSAGIGGRLRSEPEDFRVIEVGGGPPAGDGPFIAARVRLRNWETNRFADKAARALGIRPGLVGFGGMKDKRAVTEQWFSFKAPMDRLERLADLQDVEVVESYRASKRYFSGAHTGNRFVVRVRESPLAPAARREAVEAAAAAVSAAGGVPNYFGPQRFGGAVRAVTHLVGSAIVAGDLEEAVRLYLGHPMDGEGDEARQARALYEETRDPEAALAAYPYRLDLECAMLKRLISRPGEWRFCLQALPHNLLQLFVHANQSFVFNKVVSGRLAAGMTLDRAEVGDLVMAATDDGTRAHRVSERNQARVQKELDRGRAVLTGPLPGTATAMAEGAPGEVEAKVLEEVGISMPAFRASALPQVASKGRRRALLQPVGDLEVTWMDDDPSFAFTLGKGSYATVVLREFMKADVGDY